MNLEEWRSYLNRAQAGHTSTDEDERALQDAACWEDDAGGAVFEASVISAVLKKPRDGQNSLALARVVESRAEPRTVAIAACEFSEAMEHGCYAEARHTLEALVWTKTKLAEGGYL